MTRRDFLVMPFLFQIHRWFWAGVEAPQKVWVEKKTRTSITLSWE